MFLNMLNMFMNMLNIFMNMLNIFMNLLCMFTKMLNMFMNMLRLNPGSKSSLGLFFFARLNVDLCTIGKGQGKTHCLFTIHTK